MRWLLLLGLAWGFWMRNAATMDGSDPFPPGLTVPGSVTTMDGSDPFPPGLTVPGGVTTMDGSDPFPPG